MRRIGGGFMRGLSRKSLLWGKEKIVVGLFCVAELVTLYGLGVFDFWLYRWSSLYKGTKIS